MSSWVKADNRTFPQKLFGSILKCGPLPKHVAFIMDGNRRYARRNHLEQIKGHVSGFDKLAETLSWCLAMDIKEVSVYAFSIENYKRSKEEVEELFELAKEKFKKLISEKETIDKAGLCIRILGNLNLLPKDLQEKCAEIIEMTRKNDKLFLNICISYTSREEMTTACKEICNGIKEGFLDPSDVDEELIDKCLYTSHCKDVDLMIRTSGEVRLSDFLLWQSSTASISFINKLWPEFSIWNFYAAIIDYQANFDHIQDVKNYVQSVRQKCFDEAMDKCTLNTDKTNNNLEFSSILERENRINKFLTNLYLKRYESIKSMLKT